MIDVLLIGFAISAIASYVIVIGSNKGWISINTKDLLGVQKFHYTPTPRIGGVPIFFSFFGVWFVLSKGFPDSYELLAVSLPVFLGGLYEDLTGQFSPKSRMITSSVSVVLAFFWLGIGIDYLGLYYVDYVLHRYTIFSLLFTLLVVVGLINAINIIDGYNGLMPGYSILVLMAMVYVAYVVGDNLIFQFGIVLISSLLGFFVFNFPYGKIFMGDGGAYFIGFMIALAGLMLGKRNPEVSYWFVLLLSIYPLYETVFSIYRKKVVRGVSPSQPDGYHLHMLVYKRLIRCGAFKKNTPMCNSMTSPFLWALSLVGIVPAIVWYDNQKILILWTFIFMALYTILYRRIVHFKFKFKK